MSGHSHFKTIKYKKGAADAKRGNLFSKMAREIIIAAKEGGSDVNFNPKLRMSIERAKEFNMPKENIERAVKKGTGELEGVKLESVVFEAYGPGGVAVIIEGITDNKNRALGEIKKILTQNNGKLVGGGGVQWMFERKGVIIISSENKEEAELAAIESGADDLYWHNSSLDIYTKPEDLEKIRKSLEDKGMKPESVSLDLVAKEKVEINDKDKNACQKLFEALDENEAVQEIYSNFKD